MRYLFPKTAAALLLLAACNGPQEKKNSPETDTTATTVTDSLPTPYATKSTINFSNVMGWKDGRTPTAPSGLTVTALATELRNPRWLYVLPNGDILAAESSTHSNVGAKIKDAVNQPFGMLLLNNKLYVANAVAKDGALLVADDAGNTIWRVK